MYFYRKHSRNLLTVIISEYQDSNYLHFHYFSYCSLPNEGSHPHRIIFIIRRLIKWFKSKNKLLSCCAQIPRILVPALLGGIFRKLITTYQAQSPYLENRNININMWPFKFARQMCEQNGVIHGKALCKLRNTSYIEWTRWEWALEWEGKCGKRKDKKEKGKMTVHDWVKRKWVWLVVISGGIIRVLFLQDLQMFLLWNWGNYIVLDSRHFHSCHQVVQRWHMSCLKN